MALWTLHQHLDESNSTCRGRKEASPPQPIHVDSKKTTVMSSDAIFLLDEELRKQMSYEGLSLSLSAFTHCFRACLVLRSSKVWVQTNKNPQNLHEHNLFNTRSPPSQRTAKPTLLWASCAALGKLGTELASSPLRSLPKQNVKKFIVPETSLIEFTRRLRGGLRGGLWGGLQCATCNSRGGCWRGNLWGQACKRCMFMCQLAKRTHQCVGASQDRSNLIKHLSNLVIKMCCCHDEVKTSFRALSECLAWV